MIKYILIITLLFLPLSSYADAKTNERIINLAGKQRMLTQKMSKEVTLIASAINIEENINNLKKTSALFDRTLKGLKDGDEGLGLTYTRRIHIRHQLAAIEEIWERLKPIIDSIINKSYVTQNELEKVAEINPTLLRNMNKAVKLYEVDMKIRGELTSNNVINIAGRQRMFTQKMSKEFFLISLGQNKSANQENLVKTKYLFTKVLDGLIDGSKELGIDAPDNGAIVKQLKKVRSIWMEIEPILSKAADGKEITLEDKYIVSLKNLPLLKEMNKAVQMY